MAVIREPHALVRHFGCCGTTVRVEYPAEQSMNADFILSLRAGVTALTAKHVCDAAFPGHIRGKAAHTAVVDEIPMKLT